jgi:pimeloyl-ACP methyl ester carboxylesterase
LTVLGERSDELSPDVALSTHVQDVVRFLEAEDVGDAVLVGHSYAGMVIPGVAARVPQRVAQLVYLDAFVPKDGERCFDLMPAEAADSIRKEAETEGEGWRFFPFPLEMLGIVNEDDARWVEPRLGPQPLKTYDEPAHLDQGEWEQIPKTYVVCTDGAFRQVFEPFVQRARTERGWQCIELPTGHDAMVTSPERLSEILLELR